MKKNLFAVILLALAAAISAGSVTVLGPCVHGDGSQAACAGAGRAVLLDGCALAVLAVLILITRAPAARTGLLCAALCAAGAGIALPGTFFPLCRMDTMQCRAVMQPAMMILFTAALIVSACGIAAERKRIRRGKP